MTFSGTQGPGGTSRTKPGTFRDCAFQQTVKDWLHSPRWPELECTTCPRGRRRSLTTVTRSTAIREAGQRPKTLRDIKSFSRSGQSVKRKSKSNDLKLRRKKERK